MHVKFNYNEILLNLFYVKLMNNNIKNCIKMQKKASEPKNSIHLNASAGSGKTKTLIDRILLLILDGEKINNILCIAFTNVAVREIINRLQKEFKKWNLYKKKKLIQYIKNKYQRNIEEFEIFKIQNLYNACLNNSDIIRVKTLHALCFDILNKVKFINKNTLNNLKIIDNYNKQKMIENALINILNLSKNRPEINFSISNLAKKYDFYALMEFAKDIISKKQNMSQFISLHKSVKLLIGNQYNLFCTKRSMSCNELFNKFALNVPIKLKNIINNNKNNKNLDPVYLWINSNLEIKKNNLNKYVNFFLTKSLNLRQKIANKNFLNIHSYNIYIKEYIKEQSRILKFLEERSRCKQAKFMECAIIIINEIIHEYEKLKNKFKYFEYDDLIVQVSQILEKNKNLDIFLYSLNLSFSHILIDEAQDISLVQWKLLKVIIKSIYNVKSSIFIVGDYKQSIYGFQGSNPKYFLAIDKFYKNEFNKIFRSWRKLELNYSFRSKREILEVVDKVLKVKDCKNQIAHIAIQSGKGVIKIIEHCCKNNKKNKKKNWWGIPRNKKNITFGKKLQMNDVIKYIFFLLNRKNTKIKTQYKDIMVLFRKKSKKTEYIIQELKKHTIPVYEESKIALIEDMVFLDLLAIATFFLLPEDDYQLICLLKTAFFNFTEKQILKIAFNTINQKAFYKLQIMYPEISIFLLEVEQSYKRQTLYDFYTDILYKYKFLENFYFIFGGNCQEIIDIFLDKILEFKTQFFDSKTFFLKWLKYNSNICINNYTQGINIITVHNSKGLQSSIVILADASDSNDVPADSFFWYKNNLIMLNIDKYQNCIVKHAAHQNNIYLEQENLRLLYVAMTRAKNELYLFGKNNNKKKNWYFIVKNALNNNLI